MEVNCHMASVILILRLNQIMISYFRSHFKELSSYKVCAFAKIKISVSMQYAILQSAIGSADFDQLVVSFTHKRVCHESSSFLPRSVVVTMSLRQICKETARRPLKALFFFTRENKTE